MTQTERKNFGKQLKAARTKKGLRQEDCAAYCNVSVNAYQYWERGLSNPKEDNMNKICKFLELNTGNNI